MIETFPIPEEPHICSQCGHSLTRDLPVILGEWMVDPSGVTAWRNQVLPFTKMENEVLYVLAKARGRPLHDSSIEIRVGFEGGSNVITSLVSRIRKKQEAVAGYHTIETVSGAGYRWKVQG